MRIVMLIALGYAEEGSGPKDNVLNRKSLSSISSRNHW
jgi:hypothetical protein